VCHVIGPPRDLINRLEHRMIQKRSGFGSVSMQAGSCCVRGKPAGNCGSAVQRQQQMGRNSWYQVRFFQTSCLAAADTYMSTLQVLASSWFDSWRRDMRASSMMYRVAEGGMRAVGQGTMWTVAAVAGVGRATTRVMTSCVAARCACI
jgi:hypothetical protein